jgi:glycosyltransferase involved in cell wall biosynthesis
VTSIVIAAYNEAAVIGRCLDALLGDAAPGEFDITVVANGCTDNTVEVAAARPGVRVLDLRGAGKTVALNAGDEVAVGFPRIYLDADILLTADAVRALTAALATNGGAPLAAVPRRELDVSGRPLLVRAYFAIHGRLPVFRGALFGRGVIALSEVGRARFDWFPELVADDLFLDGLFAPAEKHQVDSVSARVSTPRRTRDLLNRLARVRRGNIELRAGQASGSGVRDADRLSWFRDVVVPRPWLAPAAVGYVGLTVAAAVRARRDHGSSSWARDDSSRAAADSA